MSRPSRRRYPILKGEEQTGWSKEERERFCDGFDKHGKLWSKVSQVIGTKNEDQVRYFYYRTLHSITSLLPPTLTVKELTEGGFLKIVIRLFISMGNVNGLSGDAFRSLLRTHIEEMPKISPFFLFVNQKETETETETKPLSAEYSNLTQKNVITQSSGTAKVQKRQMGNSEQKETLRGKKVNKKPKKAKTENTSKQKSEKTVSILCLPFDEKAKEMVSSHYTHVAVLLHPSSEQTIGSIVKTLTKRWKKRQPSAAMSAFSSFEIVLTLSTDEHQDTNAKANNINITSTEQSVDKFTCIWTKDAKMRCGDLFCGLSCPEIITMKYNFVEKKPSSDTIATKTKGDKSKILSNVEEISTGVVFAKSNAEKASQTQSEFSTNPPTISVPKPTAYYFSPSFRIVSPSPSPISYTQMGKKRITPMIISPFPSPHQHSKLQNTTVLSSTILSLESNTNLYSNDRPITPTLVVKENTSFSPHLNKSSRFDSFTSNLVNDNSRLFFDNNSSFLYNTTDSMFGKLITNESSNNVNFTPPKTHQNLNSLFDAVEQACSNQATTKNENNLFSVENEAMVSETSNMGFLNSLDSATESIFGLK